MSPIVPLVSLALALGAGPAEASTCVLGPYVLSLEPAADCPLVVWRAAGSVDPEPRAYVYREGIRVDVTETTTLVGPPTVLDYTVYTLDCHDTIIEENPQLATMDVFHIAFSSVQVGEKISIDGTPVGYATPTGGECTLDTPPTPYCAATYHDDTCEPGHDDTWPETDDTAGCRATSGASSSVFVGFALLALTRRRRRN